MYNNQLSEDACDVESKIKVLKAEMAKIRTLLGEQNEKLADQEFEIKNYKFKLQASKEIKYAQIRDHNLKLDELREINKALNAKICDLNNKVQQLSESSAQFCDHISRRDKASEDDTKCSQTQIMSNKTKQLVLECTMLEVETRRAMEESLRESNEDNDVMPIGSNDMIRWKDLHHRVEKLFKKFDELSDVNETQDRTVANVEQEPIDENDVKESVSQLMQHINELEEKYNHLEISFVQEQYQCALLECDNRKLKEGLKQLKINGDKTANKYLNSGKGTNETEFGTSKANKCQNVDDPSAEQVLGALLKRYEDRQKQFVDTLNDNQRLKTKIFELKRSYKKLQGLESSHFGEEDHKKKLKRVICYLKLQLELLATETTIQLVCIENCFLHLGYEERTLRSEGEQVAKVSPKALKTSSKKMNIFEDEGQSIVRNELNSERTSENHQNKTMELDSRNQVALMQKSSNDLQSKVTTLLVDIKKIDSKLDTIQQIDLQYKLHRDYLNSCLAEVLHQGSNRQIEFDDLQAKFIGIEQTIHNGNVEEMLNLIAHFIEVNELHLKNMELFNLQHKEKQSQIRESNEELDEGEVLVKEREHIAERLQFLKRMQSAFMKSLLTDNKRQ